MKKKFIFAVIAAGVLGLSVLGFFVLGGVSKVEKFGELPNVYAGKTAIGSILVNPKKYLDKTVVIEGVIAKECPGGCWMHVRDTSGGVMFVEMKGTSYAPIPQRTGKYVMVKGVVYQNQGNTRETKLLGKGLIIK